MHNPLRPAFGLAVLAVAVLLAGCGSAAKPTASASTTATPATGGPSITKAQFVGRAETICRALSAEEKPLEARQETLKALPSPTIDTAFVALVHKVVAYSRSAERQLQALPRPTSDAHAIDGLLNALSEENTDANGIAKAANTQESTFGELAAKDLKESVARNSATAAEYGMGHCIGSE